MKSIIILLLMCMTTHSYAQHNKDTCCELFKSYSQPNLFQHHPTPAESYVVKQGAREIGTGFKWAIHLADSLQQDYNNLNMMYTASNNMLKEYITHLLNEREILVASCDDKILNMVATNEYLTLIHCFNSKGTLIKRKTFLNLIRKYYKQ